jgi:hypothetical protein
VVKEYQAKQAHRTVDALATPKPTTGRPLKWSKDNEAPARDSGRFAVVPYGVGYEAEYTRPEWVGKAITNDEDDKLACVKLGTFTTKKAGKEACEAFNATIPRAAS